MVKNKTLSGEKTKITMEQEIDTNELGESIVKVLKSIYDPEIPVDIYELGLIYDVMVNTDYEVKILMTLTSPNCPVAESLPREVEEKVKTIENIKDVDVEITFDPPWSKDLMSEEAKLELGML
jgi:FeS assembly SUF system protein